MNISQLSQLEDDLRQLASRNAPAKVFRDVLLSGRNREEKVRTVDTWRSLLRNERGLFDAEDPSWVKLRQYLQGWFRRHRLKWDGPIE